MAKSPLPRKRFHHFQLSVSGRYVYLNIEFFYLPKKKKKIYFPIIIKNLKKRFYLNSLFTTNNYNENSMLKKSLILGTLFPKKKNLIYFSFVIILCCWELYAIDCWVFGWKCLLLLIYILLHFSLKIFLSV